MKRLGETEPVKSLVAWTDAQKLACLERELILRRKAYPRWVAEGRMRQADAEHEVAVLISIVEDYRAKVRGPGLFDRAPNEKDNTNGTE